MTNVYIGEGKKVHSSYFYGIAACGLQGRPRKTSNSLDCKACLQQIAKGRVNTKEVK